MCLWGPCTLLTMLVLSVGSFLAGLVVSPKLLPAAESHAVLKKFY